MIFESMSKYDAEIAKCTDYYAQQCAGMEACRGQISASNYIAANSRSLILDAQATINKMEVDIPEAKQELKEHNAKCARELRKMKDRWSDGLHLDVFPLSLAFWKTQLLQRILHCFDTLLHEVSKHSACKKTFFACLE